MVKPPFRVTIFRFLTLLDQLEKAVKLGNMTAILEILRQLIGSADNKLDLTSGGKIIPFGSLNEISRNYSNRQNKRTEEEN